MKGKLLDVFQQAFSDPSLDETVSTSTCAAWDSLGHIKLLVAIEREFRVEPSPEEILEMYADFQTVERVISGKLRSS